ncbi:MAG: hypothetical protein J6J44_04095 [Lachnospiraceae bacterium]|nr:hypothetical protein [Lachnospiraceae bacterium]
MNPMEGIDDRIVVDQKYLDMSLEELEKLYEELKSRPRENSANKELQRDVYNASCRMSV